MAAYKSTSVDKTLVYTIAQKPNHGNEDNTIVSLAFKSFENENNIGTNDNVRIAQEKSSLKGTSRQRSGKAAIRKRFPLQKPRWEKTN